jgi:hypothetical protein
VISGALGFGATGATVAVVAGAGEIPILGVSCPKETKPEKKRIPRESMTFLFMTF